MAILEVVFWFASLLILWPWIVYPLILYLAGRDGGSRDAGPTGDSSPEAWAGAHPDARRPSVTLIVSAFNEERVIDQKLDNARSLGVPGAFLDILVVDDASSDATAAIVDRHAVEDDRVRLVRMKERGGKAVGLNHAMPLARGEVVVFTDANAIYVVDALFSLVAPFADSNVGYTVGSALYHDEDAEAVNVSEGLYWRYEMWIKRLESAFHTVVGGDGAIYAIRRELYRPLEDIDISDFVNPLQIVSSGYRGVFVSEAKSFEGGTGKFSDEFDRKRRIVNRSWGAVRRYRKLFSWHRHQRFLFMLISHKVVRWWSSGFVGLALLSSAYLGIARGDGLYSALCALIALSIVMAVIGWFLDRANKEMSKPIYLVYYFYLVGMASLFGIADELRGLRRAIWSPVR